MLGTPSSLAAEAAVGAVAAAGSRAGRVGDFGRGLLKAGLGEVGIILLGVCAVEVFGAGADLVVDAA